MIVADTTQATVNRRDGIAIDKIDDVAKDCFGRGWQGASLVVITPPTEVLPVGGVGIERIFGVTMGDIGTRSCQEIFDRGR
jgi:hypothetical protein